MSTLKPNGSKVSIAEQVIEDPVSGLTIQFEQKDDGTSRLYIFGDLPLGNREFIFDRDGEEAGAGVALTGSCRPSWLTEV